MTPDSPAPYHYPHAQMVPICGPEPDLLSPWVLDKEQAGWQALPSPTGTSEQPTHGTHVIVEAHVHPTVQHDVLSANGDQDAASAHILASTCRDSRVRGHQTLPHVPAEPGAGEDMGSPWPKGTRDLGAGRHSDTPNTAQCRRQGLEQHPGCVQAECAKNPGGLATKTTIPGDSGTLDSELQAF